MIDSKEEQKLQLSQNIIPAKVKETVTTKSCLNEELQQFLRATSSIEPTENDTSEIKRLSLKPKKVVSTSLNKQRGVNKKHVKTIKNRFASLEAENNMVL